MLRTFCELCHQHFPNLYPYPKCPKCGGRIVAEYKPNEPKD